MAVTEQPYFLFLGGKKKKKKPVADLQGVHELAVTSLMNGHLQYMTSQPGEAQRAGLAQPGGKKTKDDLVHAYKCPMVEDNRTRLSSGVK